MKTFLALLLAVTGGLFALYYAGGGGDGASPGQGVAANVEPRAPAGTPPRSTSPADTPTGPVPAPSSGPMMVDPDDTIAAQNEILAAPLFARSRKPGEGFVAAAVASPDATGGAVQPARLMGIMIAPPMRRALLRFSDGTPEWVGEGEETRGWTVKAISPRDAVLVGAAGETTLELHAPGP
jgi:hypothetical protein